MKWCLGGKHGDQEMQHGEFLGLGWRSRAMSLCFCLCSDLMLPSVLYPPGTMSLEAKGAGILILPSLEVQVVESCLM